MISLSEDVDKILNELKNKQPSAPSSEENADQMLEKIQEERRSKVDQFQAESGSGGARRDRRGRIPPRL